MSLTSLLVKPNQLELLFSEAVVHKCYSIIGVFKNYAKFTGKHPCHSLPFNKVAGLMRATLFKKRLRRRCFS